MSDEQTIEMSLEAAIRRRRSVRAFQPREVAEPVLREFFALAQWAPSNCNAQPWTPHVASGLALRRLAAALLEAAAGDAPPAPDFEANWTFKGVYRERQIDAALQLYGAMGVERRDMAARRAAYLRNFVAFDAPHAVFAFLPAEFGIREAVDVGMWAQTLMLAFAARGISSCAQGALSLYPDLVRAQLGIAPEQRLLFGIAFGYEDESAKANVARVGRAELDEAVRFHR